jgi:hypothetical protein
MPYSTEKPAIGLYLRHIAIYDAQNSRGFR